MELLSILQNLIESFLYALCTASYMEFKGANRFSYVICFTAVFAGMITAMNVFVFFESFLILLPMAVMAVMMYLFQWSKDKVSLANLAIYALFWNNTLSICSDFCMDLHYVFSGMSSLSEFMNSDGYSYIFWSSRLLVFLILMITNRYSSRYKSLQSRYSGAFIVIFVILAYAIIFNETIIYNADPRYRIFIAVNILLWLVSVISYFVFSQSSLDHMKEQIHSELALELKSVREFENSQKDKENALRELRHDMRNQYIVLKGYLDHGKTDECRNLIEKNLEAIDELPVMVFSGYSAIDAILSVKLSKAHSSGIKTLYSVHLPPGMTQEMEYDIAVILGNLLDNALENNTVRTDHPYIHLKAEGSDAVFITVANTTYNSDFRTKKKDAYEHGIGLKSVQSLCDMHHGSLNIQIRDGICTAVAILNNTA